MECKKSFWPVFVLTLEGDDARRAGLLKRLDELAMPYQLHFGVDGRSGLKNEFEDLVDREGALQKNGRELSDGEFACALSHRTIYQEVIHQNAAGAIVLEDDAIVDERLVEFIRSESYKAADLVMLDHSHARVWGSQTPLGGGSVAHKLSLPSCLTTAYSISAEACRELITATSPLVDLADWPGDICRLGALALLPQIVTHPDASTGVSHLRAERAELLTRRSSPARFFRPAFWRRWITKRLSTRIS